MDHLERLAWLTRREGMAPLDYLHDQRHLVDPSRADGHDTDGIAGDCWRAALATVLGVPDDLEVPHACHYEDDYDAGADSKLIDEHGGLWWRRTRRFLREQHGLDIASYESSDIDDLRIYGGRDHAYPWSGWVIASGPSPRGPFDHATVGLYRWTPLGCRPGRLRPEVVVAFDPHPSRAGLDEVTSVQLLCAPYDPAPPVEG
jgi:hypothetical protein